MFLLCFNWSKTRGFYNQLTTKGLRRFLLNVSPIKNITHDYSLELTQHQFKFLTNETLIISVFISVPWGKKKKDNKTFYKLSPEWVTESNTFIQCIPPIWFSLSLSLSLSFSMRPVHCPLFLSLFLLWKFQ